MYKTKMILIFFSVIIWGCESKQADKRADTITAKTEVKKGSDSTRIIDSILATGDRPDSEQVGPSPQDERKRYIESYKKVKKIDTLILDKKDSLKFHLKYFSLNDNSLIVPKKYVWGETSLQKFVTHNFISQVILLRNKDTIFNKLIGKSDFSKVVSTDIKNYGTIMDPNFVKYDRNKSDVILQYSISIPVTDIGVAAFVIIDKNGNVKIISDYDYLNNYK